MPLSAGEGSAENFAATCSISLPSKLGKVQLAAKLFSSTNSPASVQLEQPTHSPADHSVDRPSDTVKLARFLSELSPEGTGGFDTSCLITQDWKTTKAHQHGEHWPRETATAGHSSASILQTISHNGSHSSTVEKLSQWLTPTVAVFSGQEDSQNSQQLCLVQKTQHSLGDVLRFSPQALQDDSHCRLILFQILSCLYSVHAQGLHLGKLSPDCVWLTLDRSALALSTVLHVHIWQQVHILAAKPCTTFFFNCAVMVLAQPSRCLLRFALSRQPTSTCHNPFG